VKLSTQQVETLDALRQELRQLEQLRRSVNARIATGRLKGLVRPLFLPTFNALWGDIERALLEHELEANRDAFEAVETVAAQLGRAAA
jgi:hypothetical protein